MMAGVAVVVEHKADVTYPVVSAASIIAKVERDREIDVLKAQHGDLGSGYPSDPRTIQWLKRWLEKNRQYPDFVRKSWVTAELLQEEKKQPSLGSWLRSVAQGGDSTS
jgi:ribonuclease HII